MSPYKGQEEVLYNAAELRKALEKNGATLVSDTLYLVDKEHTEQWALN